MAPSVSDSRGGEAAAGPQEKLGRSEEEMTAVAISAPEAPAAPKRTLPVYNGFGSFEDSAQNCTSLLPQPPKKNFYSLMQVPQRHVHVAFVGMCVCTRSIMPSIYFF